MGTITQTKIIRSSDTYGLETEINDWIKEHQNDHIIDIKYMFDNSFVGFRRIPNHYAVITYETISEVW